MDLRDHLDHLAADEPAHRPVEERLHAGRRALRRRRAAGMAATTVVLAAVASGYAVATAGGDGRATEPPAAPPTSTTQTVPAPPPVPDQWATWRRGEVVVADGVVEMERIDAGQDGVGLQLRVGGDVRWYLVGRGSTTSTDSSVAFDSLADWVADQTSGTGAADRAALVQLAADGSLTPGRDGVTILEQVASPDLPDSYDGGDLVTAAALVEVDGEQQWLLARDPAATDVITVPLARAGTMQEFLDFARERYAEGPGGGSEGLL